LVLHTSPFWVQNEGWLEQRPFEQSFEQQSPFPAHALPDVLHDPLSAAHRFAPPSPATHDPPQQVAFEVHASLSEVHRFFPHLPPSQTKVQHSLPVAQESPDALHVPIGFTHIFVVASQTAEQQSALTAHAIPLSAHVSASALGAASPNGGSPSGLWVASTEASPVGGASFSADSLPQPAKPTTATAEDAMTASAATYFELIVIMEALSFSQWTAAPARPALHTPGAGRHDDQR
jgi:hypothetical protein